LLEFIPSKWFFQLCKFEDSDKMINNNNDNNNYNYNNDNNNNKTSVIEEN